MYHQLLCCVFQIEQNQLAFDIYVINVNVFTMNVLNWFAINTSIVFVLTMCKRKKKSNLLFSFLIFFFCCLSSLSV
jgi:hypothetical protein